jgi:trehalose-6-phosphatase
MDVRAPDSRLTGALDALRDAPAEVAILCDVDGTLAPIVPRPEDAALIAGARPVLAALREEFGGHGVRRGPR